MSGHWSGSEAPERPVETRLRRALAARAEQITLAGLRPADPPGPRLRRTPLARLRLRRLGLPLAGLATAAAVAVGYFTLAPGHDEQRPLPAGPPGPVEPPPTPAPSTSPGPRPAPSAEPSKASSEVSPPPPQPPAGPVNRLPSRAAGPQRSAPPSAPPVR
ncbi:hypothetical protein [Streptomyces sp. NPDC050485]|uniref:hypothetical protein n=1 Tax=Streptomyces sp. NPDC050485 TaxID=3365617 RepID=UPI00379FEEC4